MDFTNIDHLAALAAILTTAAAGVVFVWKKGIIPLYQYMRKLTKIFDQIDFIAEQLKPNGGGSLRDAIDQIHAEMDTSIQRQRLTMMDNSTPMFETNKDGVCIFANNAYLELVDRRFEEIQGNGWMTALHPEDREWVTQEWLSAVEQDRIFELSGYRYLTPGGIERAVFCKALPMHNRKGINCGWIGFEKLLHETVVS